MRLLLQVDEQTVCSVPPQWTDLMPPEPELRAQQPILFVVGEQQRLRVVVPLRLREATAPTLRVVGYLRDPSTVALSHLAPAGVVLERDRAHVERERRDATSGIATHGPPPVHATGLAIASHHRLDATARIARRLVQRQRVREADEPPRRVVDVGLVADRRQPAVCG